MNNIEIECRFLEIDKEAIIKKLHEIGAVDEGEVMLEEAIIYNPDDSWRKDNRFVRVRKSGDTISLSYKEHRTHTIDGTFEIELHVDDYDKAVQFLEATGLKTYRRQQKKRHTFTLDGVTFDIDTWPRIPAYIEIEGDSEEKVKKAATAIGLDYSKAVFENASVVIEEVYKIPVKSMKWFTFDRFE